MVMQPTEYDPWLSKIDFQVIPRLVVFHTPPDAIATYQTLRFLGSTAMSPMRPGVMHGPIGRSPSAFMPAVLKGTGSFARGGGARAGSCAVEVWTSASARVRKLAERKGVDRRWA